MQVFKLSIFATELNVTKVEAKIIEFIKERPSLSVNNLEKEAGLAQGTLSKAVHGVRRLTQRHIDKLLPVLQRYGFSAE